MGIRFCSWWNRPKHLASVVTVALAVSAKARTSPQKGRTQMIEAKLQTQFEIEKYSNRLVRFFRGLAWHSPELLILPVTDNGCKM